MIAKRHTYNRQTQKNCSSSNMIRLNAQGESKAHLRSRLPGRLGSFPARRPGTTAPSAGAMREPHGRPAAGNRNACGCPSSPSRDGSCATAHQPDSSNQHVSDAKDRAQPSPKLSAVLSAPAVRDRKFLYWLRRISRGHHIGGDVALYHGACRDYGVVSDLAAW